MGQIYSTAQQVAIWLGAKVNDENGFSFKTLRSYADRWGQGRYIDDRNEAERDKSIDAAVHAVFWRPWFERLWVFQEAVLAKGAAVLYGDGKIAWGYFYKASAWLRFSGLSWRSHDRLMTVKDIQGTRDGLLKKMN
jgi:hypothetical protein